MLITMIVLINQAVLCEHNKHLIVCIVVYTYSLEVSIPPHGFVTHNA